MYYINMCSLVYCSYSRTLVQPQEYNEQNIYETTKLWTEDLASAEGGCLISTSCFVLGKHNLSRNRPEEPLRNLNAVEEE